MGTRRPAIIVRRAEVSDAVALYRKFGFEVEGTLRQDAFRDGRYVDAYLMARLRPQRNSKEEVKR